MLYLPKISIIIPTHKRKQMCERAVSSAINQSYDNLEILVSNDSEEDYLIEHNPIFKNKKVKYFIKSKEGYDKNYIFLMEKISGDFVYCLEDDDYFIDKNIIKECVLLINKYENVNAVLINSSLNFKEAISFKSSFKEIYSNKEFFKLFPKISNNFQFGNVLSRASVLKQIILEEIPKHLGSVNSDSFIFLLLCLVKGNICHTNKVGYMITVNGDNQSWNNYENCFFGGNSYIQEIAKRASSLIKEIDIWKDEMEYEHIYNILRFLPEYLNEVCFDKHS